MFFLNGCTHVTREVQLFADRRREERCNLACVGGGAGPSLGRSERGWARLGREQTLHKGMGSVPTHQPAGAAGMENTTGLGNISWPHAERQRGRARDESHGGAPTGSSRGLLGA